MYMGIFDGIFGSKPSNGGDQRRGVIDYGKQKSDGSHDHRTNSGKDRTPAQKEGDQKRRKD